MGNDLIGCFMDIFFFVLICVLCFGFGYLLAKRHADEKEQAVIEQMRRDYEYFNRSDNAWYHPDNIITVQQPPKQEPKDDSEWTVGYDTSGNAESILVNTPRPRHRRDRFVLPTDFMQRIQNGERATIKINRGEMQHG